VERLLAVSSFRYFMGRMTNMLNIAFCDDDRDFLNKLTPMTKKILRGLKTNASIHIFTNAQPLIKSFEQYKPYYDIVFLDIDMPAINGKEVARKLRLIDKKFKLAFITAFEEEVLNTFQFDVSDFLPKPLLEERLPMVIKRIIKAIDEENPRIQIFRIRNAEDVISTIKVPLNDIIYIESVNREIYLHTQRRIYLLHGHKFSALVEQYGNLEFVAIHRTCILNLKYVFSIDNIDIRLDDGTVLPLSRRKRQCVLDKFLETVSEAIKC